MKKEEIKKIMIIHNDNDFVRVWDWIGEIVLKTLTRNICGEEMLEDSETIEEFVLSLLPTAIEFTQYKVGKYENWYMRLYQYEKYCRYKDITKDEVDRLSDYFKNVKFIYNFDETDDNFRFGGSETLIIDLEENKSYIN